MVTAEAITRSLHDHWSVGFTASTTAYPGQQLETSALADWVELWVEMWDEAIRRDVAPCAVDVAVTVHCFSRSVSAVTRGQRLADAARSVLSHQTIEVRDFEMSGEPLLGHVRLREAETRDLTRRDGDENRGVLQHVVVVVGGRADSLVAAS